MFKFNKYIMLIRSSSKLGYFRYSCNTKCPPRYECKQPKSSKEDPLICHCKRHLKHPLFQEKHVPDYRIPQNIFIFLCVPIIICLFINMYIINPEEIKRPKFKKYEYMRIRRTKYPWDPVRTLFHNPKVNALPDGYEEDIPEENEIDPSED